MKLKIMSVLAAFAMVAAFSLNADAQYMTQDVIFLKAGYIPVYNVSYDEEGDDWPDLESRGFAIQGEYNLNFSGFWLGFGMEYQYTKVDLENSKNIANQFILPMASIKVAAVGGLYVGGGIAGKYLIATEKNEEYEAKKKVDLWANGILGYHTPIGEGLFLDLEGRFGWNLTNKQFSEYENVSETYKMKNAYDIAFYAGIGFRALGSNY